MNKLLRSLLLVSLLSLGLTSLSAQTSATAPKSVIHVVTVKWKDGTTEAQIKAALDGAQKLPAQYKGITRVWTRAINVQNAAEIVKDKKTHVIVMEFADEKALADYSGSPAQTEWYKVYLDIRGVSTTFDITN
jgi:hypothetical protein